MLHLKKSKNGQFYVIAVSKNGRTLFKTETFTSKPSAFANIKSVAKVFQTAENLSVFIQDNTLLDGPVVYELFAGTINLTDEKPSKRVP